LRLGKPAQPHEVVGAIGVAELSEDVHADCLLSLDELAIEQLDQGVAFAGVEQVLAELDQLGGGATGDRHMSLFRCRYPYWVCRMGRGPTWSGVGERHHHGAGDAKNVVRECLTKGVAHLVLSSPPGRASGTESAATGFGERDDTSAPVARVDRDTEQTVAFQECNVSGDDRTLARQLTGEFGDR
jgi:hypothetical protein